MFTEQSYAAELSVVIGRPFSSGVVLASGGQST